jgi:hypothetical protein
MRLKAYRINQDEKSALPALFGRLYVVNVDEL